jgi:glycyl-tRNA synthetase beta chain
METAAMPELLLELLSEEIPARMQVRAAEDLKLMLVNGLTAAGLGVGAATAFATPRRLTVVIDAVPERSADTVDERKGPRLGSPQPALDGFLKSAGYASLDEAEIVRDAKKGDFYVARIHKPGRSTAEILGTLVPEIIRGFSWPKSMRWGASRLRWVRPLQGILCLHESRVVPIEVEGLVSSNATVGHRFLHGGTVMATSFAEYREKLAAANVILAGSDRAGMIAEQARKLAAKHGLDLVEDEGLLDEVAGLVEWPHVLMGQFDADFLAVPGEVLTTAMRAHQKCFSLRDPRTKRLANRFLLVSNLIPQDGGTAIIAGNEKVIRARLSDARFFWDQDLKRPLDDMWSSLRSVTFHEQLGSQHERVERLAALAETIAPLVGADPIDTRRAAQLAKADLMSGVVGEFPELQGLMGRYYAEAAGAKPGIAKAIEEHYWPRGQGDMIPTAPISVALALADKLDMLVGFWAIDEKPTGSKDPFGLRRAALGMIRIILENGLRLNLILLTIPSLATLFSAVDQRALQRKTAAADVLDSTGRLKSTIFDAHFSGLEISNRGETHRPTAETISLSLFDFFIERMKVLLREQGKKHDLVDAVLAVDRDGDLLMIVRRVEALGAFLATDDGASLLAGAKRGANILRIEEKKDKRSYGGEVDPTLLKEPAERLLDAAMTTAQAAVKAAIADEDFAGAMSAMAKLRGPVDTFFTDVTVNADDPAIRTNRLNLLARIRTATQTVADFSRIAG